MGIRTDGIEQEIENLIINYIQLSGYDEFRFLEVGSAGGLTLKAVYEIVQENIKHENWRIDGLDMIGGWSLDMEQIEKFGYPLGVYKNGLREPTLTVKDEKAFLWLEDDPRKWIWELKDNSIDICFIDGCHGLCAIRDFLAVESKIKSEGLVLFHDIGVLEQGSDWQEHCKEFINVRHHLHDLGLFDNQRDFWKFVKEIPGSRMWGGDGNSVGVFQKT